MSIYWLLLGITAILAYFFGSMDTMVLASNFVFHRNLLQTSGGSSASGAFSSSWPWSL